MHNFSPFSLRFSASVLFCSLCYVNEVDTWSFLACLDSFACSFLVCFLQHYEAELSMLQSSRVCNSTAQNKTSATFSLELGVTANLSDWYFNCATFWLGKQNLIDCCTDSITTSVIIRSVIFILLPSFKFDVVCCCIKQIYRCTLPCGVHHII